MLRVSLLFITLCFSYLLTAQSTSSQDAPFIVELEAVQSPITSTFVSCSMKRIAHLQTSEDQILVHRSSDQTASWQLIETYIPETNGRLIDPVINVDDMGVFYLIFMDIEDSSIPMAQRQTALPLYRSTDDGLTWEFMGSAYTDIFPDYPQLLARGNGELFLAFGDYTGPLQSNIKFMTSTDGGATWSLPEEFEAPLPEDTGCGIPDLNWGSYNSIHMSFGSDIKGPCHTKSQDLGASWSDYVYANQNLSAADTNVLSKVISNPNFNFYGIISHRPHFSDAIMTYHYPSEDGDTLETVSLGNGAYAEGMLTDDGLIHIVNNDIVNSEFRIIYRASNDQGQSFTEPIVLYTATNEFEEYGEYQSLLLGQDGQFYLTFCDWSDQSIAKSLVFTPLQSDDAIFLSLPETSLDTNFKLYPNPSLGNSFVSYPNASQISEISIHTLDGKLLKTIKPEAIDHLLHLDLSELAAGSYILRFKEGARFVIRKWIKY